MLKNNELLIQVFFEKLRIMLLECVVLSFIVSLLCTMGVFPDRSTTLTVGLYFVAALFFVSNFFHTRVCYGKLADKYKYYISNIGACIVFAIISVIAYLMLPSEIFVWGFSITKVFRGTQMNFTTSQSMLLFHSVLTICVFLAPIGLGWVKFAVQEEEELLELAPDFLDVNLLEQKNEDVEK